MAWVQLAGAAISAVGKYKQGMAASQADAYNAAIASQNSTIALQQGDAAVQAQDRDARRRLGSMKALYGASGVESDSGSPLDVLADSARMAELDSLTTTYNYQLKSQGFDEQAQIDRAQSASARSAAIMSATSSVLQSAGSYMGSSGGSS